MLSYKSELLFLFPAFSLLVLLHVGHDNPPYKISFNMMCLLQLEKHKVTNKPAQFMYKWPDNA